MTAKNLPFKFFLIVAVLLVLFSCKTTADFQIKQIPQPPPTTKVRIFVLMITGDIRGFWLEKHNEWSKSAGNRIAKLYSDTDIYDVIRHEELYRVMIEEPADWQWERNDWELAKRLGRALHADYLFIQKREAIQGMGIGRMVSINLETETKIETTILWDVYVSNPLNYRGRKLHEDARIDIFNRSKAELLALALRKRGLAATSISTMPVATVPLTPSVEKPVIKEPPEIKPPTIPPKVEVAKPTPPVKKPVVKKPPKIKPPATAPKVELAKTAPVDDKPIVTPPPQVAQTVTPPKVDIPKPEPPLEKPIVVKPMEVPSSVSEPKIQIVSPEPLVEKTESKKPVEMTPPVPLHKVEVAKPSPAVKKPDNKKVSETEPPITAQKIEIAKVTPPVERSVVRKAPKAESPGIDSRPHKAKTAPPVENSIDKKPPPIESPVSAPKVELAKVTPVIEKPIFKEVSVIAPQTKKSDAKRKIVVYDIETSDQLKVVGLILSEATRQEFLTTGQYSLINRENINLIMEEHKLRGSGLIDDRKASALGNWMSADEAVTGKLSMLGNVLILQLKMININTVETISLGSIHGSVGKEMEMIREMSSLVRQLVEGRK